MESVKRPEQLSELSELLADGTNPRKPVRVTISLDASVYEALKKESGSMSFSRAVELILKRALKRGAA